ncbi:MAG: hypothetical protein V3T84_02270 [Phycisphaerales bacterium]
MTDPAESFEAFEAEVLNIRRAWEFGSWISGNHPGAPDAIVFIKAAPTFHWYASQGLLTYVVLGLSRLADPTTDHQGRENLTLERIHQETDFTHCSDRDSRAGHAMTKALEIIRSDDFKKARNKALAHNDLKVILAKDALVEMEVIRKGVQWVACFHARIKAVREGTGISLATGKGVFPRYADVQVCEDEIVNLLVRLQRSQ